MEQTFQTHPIVWIASLLCCIGMVSLLFTSVSKRNKVYDSVTFLPTYAIGILAWLLYGIEIDSAALIYPCLIQILVLCILLKRSISYRGRNTDEL